MVFLLSLKYLAISVCRKQLKDLFNSTVLHETVVKILDIFMSMGSPYHWVDYIMPEDARFYKFVAFSDSAGTNLSDVTKFDQLMVETRAVLSRYCHFPPFQQLSITTPSS